MDTDLKNYIFKNKNNQPSLFQRIIMAHHIAMGLNWGAEQMNLRHNDLKPSNILLSGLVEGKWVTSSKCKVTDFGLALTQFSTERMSIGNAEYSSPEARKFKSTDEKSDVYSYGWILFNLVSWEDEISWPVPLEEHLKFVTNDKAKESFIKRTLERQACPEVIIDLIILCTKTNNSSRPRFSEILATFDKELFVASAIPKIDSEAYKFWKMNIGSVKKKKKSHSSIFYFLL